MYYSRSLKSRDEIGRFSGLVIVISNNINESCCGYFDWNYWFFICTNVSKWFPIRVNFKLLLNFMCYCQSKMCRLAVYIFLWWLFVSFICAVRKLDFASWICVNNYVGCFICYIAYTVIFVPLFIEIFQLMHIKLFLLVILFLCLL